MVITTFTLSVTTYEIFTVKICMTMTLTFRSSQGELLIVIIIIIINEHFNMRIVNQLM